MAPDVVTTRYHPIRAMALCFNRTYAADGTRIPERAAPHVSEKQIFNEIRALGSWKIEDCATLTFLQRVCLFFLL